MGLVNSKDNSTNFIIIKIDVNRQLKESLLLKGSPELEKFKKICEKYGIFEIGFGLDSKTIDIEILETEKDENFKEIFTALKKLDIITVNDKKLSYKVKKKSLKIYSENKLVHEEK